MSLAEPTVSTAVAEPPGIGVLGRRGLLASELATVFRSVRNLVLLAVLALVPLVLGLAIKAGAVHSGSSGTGGSTAFIGQVTGNGLFLVFASLSFAMPYFLPMAVAVVAGDSLAGEAARGTLRYLLIAPAGRLRLLLVKLAGVVVFCFAATLTVAASAVVSGALLFPIRAVTLLSGQELPASQALVRVLLIALCVCASMLGIGAVGLCASSFTDVPIVAMAVTVGLGVGVSIADSIPQLSAIQPWLFSHDWLSFADLLRTPVYTSAIVHNLWIQLAYVSFFGSCAWARFTGRDVLC
jgi:ABC-2 type transport system permease protein